MSACGLRLLLREMPEMLPCSPQEPGVSHCERGWDLLVPSWSSPAKLLLLCRGCVRPSVSAENSPSQSWGEGAAHGGHVSAWAGCALAMEVPAPFRVSGAQVCISAGTEGHAGAPVLLEGWWHPAAPAPSVDT